MKYAVLSDIHGNLEALEAVLEDIPSDHQIVSLGDNIGYMANPNEIMDIIWDEAIHKTIGNHEYSVYEAINDTGRYLRRLNSQAYAAIMWTKDILSDTNKQRLEELIESEEYSIEENSTLFAHTLPADNNFNYIQQGFEASYFFLNLEEYQGMIGFIGHTHIPKIFAEGYLKKGEIYDLEPCSNALITVPSVGQPRDGDWKTGYVRYDSDLKLVQPVRLEYQLNKTQQKIMDTTLPIGLAKRIEMGR